MLQVECRCFAIVAVFGNSVAGFGNKSNEISSFRQIRNKSNMFNLLRLCRKDEISFDIVAVFGNKVECCFDIVAGVDGALLYVIVGECDVR